MARANDNRKPVGTEYCGECGTIARFFQVQKGNRLGYLYRRCECGADQRSGAAVQLKWLSVMEPTGSDMIPHPMQAQVKNEEGESSVESSEPLEVAGVEEKTESKKVGLFGLLILVAAGAVAILT